MMEMINKIRFCTSSDSGERQSEYHFPFNLDVSARIVYRKNLASRWGATKGASCKGGHTYRRPRYACVSTTLVLDSLQY
jgi:hypothetical protein